MAEWTTFAGLVGVVCVLLLALSRLTERAVTPAASASRAGDRERRSDPRAAGRTPRSPTGGRRSSSASSSRSTRVSDPANEVEHGSAVEPASEGEPAGATDPASDADPASERAPVDRPDGSEPAARPGRLPNGAATDPTESADSTDPTDPTDPTDEADAGAGGVAPFGRPDEPETVAARVHGQPVSSGALLANVALTQGLFVAAVIGAAVYTRVPAEALGVSFTRGYLATGLVVGVAAGFALYAANEFGAAVAKRRGIDHSEDLREMLAPETAGGWIGLLFVVLPLIALFEEVLFRAALVGALSVGFGVSPWLLAIGSSILFAIGHGIQGTAGIVVTGLLGFVLAAVFVLTWNLLAVIVAHYVINACEFVVHEGLEIEWASSIGG